MTPIKIMLNGLPGNVATTIARHMLDDPRVVLLPYSLTGPDIETQMCLIDNHEIQLIRPETRESMIETLKEQEGAFISVDYTHPSAVNDNAAFYCRNRLPFVMGTTGGDREKLSQIVQNSKISAVIAPNMAKQIVGFQAMMAYAAETFPNLFKGYRLSIKESHQSGKADTSGTAKAMVGYFNRMGIPFSTEEIEKERDPKTQSELWKIPAAHLNGHAWHTYTLVSADETATFKFEHNINGRDIYAEGTLDAVIFLAQKLAFGTCGQVYNMIDVLKGA